jgi:hypothetical protein
MSHVVRRTVIAVGATIVLLNGGCTDNRSSPEAAAEIVDVDIPASARDIQSEVNSGRDGSFVQLEFTVPNDEWEGYVSQYPTIELVRSETSCIQCSHFSREGKDGKPYYRGSDEIDMTDNGHTTWIRNLSVIPGEPSGRSWIIWSNSRSGVM